MRILLICLLLSGCGALSAIGSLAPGGPSVDAQVGQTNEQNESVVSVRREGTSNQQRVQAERVDAVTVNEADWPLLVLLVLGWLAPSPREIWREIRSLWK